MTNFTFTCWFYNNNTNQLGIDPLVWQRFTDNTSDSTGIWFYTNPTNWKRCDGA